MDQIAQLPFSPSIDIKEVDIAPYYFSPTVQGTKKMDFFYASSYSSPEVILIAYPEQKNEKLFAIIKPFQLKVICHSNINAS